MTKKHDAKDALPVIFRTDIDNGDILAIFPTVPLDLDGGVRAYLSPTQELAVDYDMVMKSTSATAPEDYAALKAGLAAKLGHNFRVCTRMTAELQDNYQEALKVLVAEAERRAVEEKATALEAEIERLNALIAVQKNKLG